MSLKIKYNKSHELAYVSYTYRYDEIDLIAIEQKNGRQSRFDHLNMRKANDKKQQI